MTDSLKTQNKRPQTAGSRTPNPNAKWGYALPDQTPEDGGPVMPAGMNAAEKKKWNELLSQLDSRSMRKVDSHEFMLLVTSLMQLEKLRKVLRTTKAVPADHRHFRQYFDIVHKLSACFGLNPVDRRRMAIEPQKTSKADELIARLGGSTN